MIIATAGHVDHGKSALVERLTGINTDRLQEERDRGLTIDLGFAYTKIGGRQVGFVDVPGHIRFINNMLAGVGSVNLALLVIAADDGVMPQTLEHLAIIDALALPALIVAITKTDRVDSNRLTEVQKIAKQLLQTSNYPKALIMTCSAITGDGIDALEEALIEQLESLPRQESNGYLRLAIDRSFSVRGSGSVITGAIRSGTVRVTEELHDSEAGRRFRVRGLHRLNTEASFAQSGDRCALNLTGPNSDLSTLSRGTWLTNNPELSARSHCDMLLRLENKEKKPLKHWTAIHVYHAAQHTTGHIAVLQHSPIDPGHSGLIQLVTQDPLTLCVGDRVLFRDQGATRTLGSGLVLDPLAASKGRARPERIQFLKRIADAQSETDSAKVFIAQTPGGCPIAHLSRNLNWHPEQITTFLKDNEEVLRFNEFLVLAEAFEAVAQKLLLKLNEWHLAHPNEKGLNHSQISHFLPRDCFYTEVLLKLLKSQNKLAQSGSLFHLPGATVSLPAETQRLFGLIEEHLRKSPKQPPVLHDLSRLIGVPPKTLMQHLIACTKSGLLIHPVKNRFFLPETISELVELTQSVRNGQAFTVQDYRDAAGIGRNLCIEILEYFDHQGLTRRDGNQRFPKAP
jgi:selenocysteine-specific elongation factor